MNPLLTSRLGAHLARGPETPAVVMQAKVRGLMGSTSATLMLNRVLLSAALARLGCTMTPERAAAIRTVMGVPPDHPLYAYTPPSEVRN